MRPARGADACVLSAAALHAQARTGLGAPDPRMEQGCATANCDGVVAQMRKWSRRGLPCMPAPGRPSAILPLPVGHPFPFRQLALPSALRLTSTTLNPAHLYHPFWHVPLPPTHAHRCTSALSCVLALPTPHCPSPQLPRPFLLSPSRVPSHHLCMPSTRHTPFLLACCLHV